MNPRVDVLLRQAREMLKQAGIESYAIDSMVLMMYVLGISKEKLLASPEMLVTESQQNRLKILLTERTAKKPIQYIISHCEFMSLDFYVDENVLIPRGDTEVLVESALARLQNPNKEYQVIELGTGSGCIAVSLAHYVPAIAITAVDISPNALAVAKQNADANGVGEKIEFVQSDLWQMLQPQKVDMILSNPPYIKTQEIQTLDVGVQCYEPNTALDGGVDGLDFYRRISEQAAQFLKPNGYLLLEIGSTQANEVRTLLQNYGWEDIETIPDLAGLDRVITARRA